MNPYRTQVSLVVLAFGGAIAVAPSPLAAQRRDSTTTSNPIGMATSGPRVLVQNRYYAKPGKENEVYEWRLHASEVLRQLGLQSGTVFRGPGGHQPDAVWQIVADSATLVREGRVALESPEFKAVMRHMETLVRRFESGGYLERRVNVEPDGAPPPASPR